MTPWYTDEEVNSICAGLVNNAAKVRYMQGMGLTVNRKPNGAPLVMRAHAEAVLSGLQQLQAAAAPKGKHVPDLAAYRNSFGKSLKAA